MKFPAYLHTSTTLVGQYLSPEHKKIFNLLLKDLNRYLNAYTLREDHMKDFLNSWNQINNESFLPVLHQMVKLIRHRLVAANSVAFHRLIHLCNALLRNGGTAAHALIGREKFLRTIVYCIEWHSRSRHVLSRDAAAYAFQCFKEWKVGLKERKDLFPYYSKVFNKKLANKYEYLSKVDLSAYSLPLCERGPVTIAEEYRILDPPSGIPKLQEEDEEDGVQISPHSSIQYVPSTRSSVSKFSIGISDDEQSLQLNRISSSTSNSPAPSSFMTTTSMNLSPRKSEKLTIIQEEEKANDDDDATAEEQYCESSSTAAETNKDFLLSRASSRHISVGTVGTIRYEKIYEATKSTDEISRRSFKKAKSDHAVEVTPSAAARTFSCEQMNMDIQVKYYGTQRVVSYKQKSVLSSASNSHLIMQQ